VNWPAQEPKKKRIAVVPGSGIGRGVIPQAVKVILGSGADVDLIHFNWDADRHLRDGVAVLPDGLTMPARNCDAILARVFGDARERIHSISMPEFKTGPRWLVVVALAAFLCAPVLARDARPAEADKNARPAQVQDQSKPPDNKEPRIAPHQAEELLHSVDEILEFDSKQTGLPIRKAVKRKLTSRDEVVGYLTQHMNDEDTRRLRRSELVLKKFGLLPRDFNLETFLVALLREEVAGYYDPKTKTVNLLDWVPIEEQEPVVAHELTHALQDQAVGLQKWMKKGEKDLAEIKKDPTPTDIENDEIADVREAVIEGQAQAMMLQYALAPVGRSLTDSPQLVEAMEQEMLTGTSGTKVFNEAPVFMKESLTFPYSYGMEFVVKLMEKGGKEKAFAAALRNPPRTTRQIMQPETYLSGEKIEPMPVPDFKRDFRDYQKFDIGAMGEFDVAVLIEQYAGKPLSKQLYPEWRGGYYYAARFKSGGKPDAAAPLGLLYVSRWSTAEKAAEFAAIYAQSLKQRYKKAEEVTDFSSDQLASDKLVAQGKSAQGEERKTDLLKGRHAWNTEEGAVIIEEQGQTVFVSESLDAATTAALEREVFRSPATEDNRRGTSSDAH
jgi:hypothetical protein